MALRVKELVLRLLCSLKLANNPSLDSSHCRVTTRFFSKIVGFPSLYESCQPFELVRLTWSSHRFENNKVGSFAYFYNFQYQDYVIQIMHEDCEYTSSLQYETTGSRGLIHLSSLFSTCLTCWLETFLPVCASGFSICFQGRSSIKIPRYRLDSLKLWPLVLMHIFINYFRFQTKSYVQRCSPGLSCY